MMALAGGLALILMVVAALAFLGGAPEPTEPTAPAAAVATSEPEKKSKRKQFIYDADQICADIMTQANDLPIPTTLDEAVALMNQVKAIIMDARERGFKLDVPKDARRGWARMMGTDQDIAEFDAVIEALKIGDIAAFQAWEAKNKGSGKRDQRWAKRYGMKVCSQDLS